MILLINPKTIKPTEFQTDFFREPNNGLLSLATVLDRFDIPVDILDLEQYYNLSEIELYEAILKKADKYDIIGLTTLTNTYHFAAEIAQALKNQYSNKNIILGGPHASFQYKEILQSQRSIDLICVGEAENSFPKVIKILLGGKKGNKKVQDMEQKLNNIKGLAFRNSKQEISFTGYPDPVDIKEIPIPARFKLEQTNFYYRVANVIINRGCPNQCSFCSRQKLFKHTRIRSIESILSEIRDILYLQTYDYINFYDNINIDKLFFRDFCNALIFNKFNISWGCELRVDNLTHEDALLLKDSGCKLVATGIESASLDVLKANFKYQDPDRVREGIGRLKEVDIPIQAYFVLGLPGETETSFKNTIKFIKTLPFDEYDRINYFIATPYPGSRLWEESNDFSIKILERDFSKYDCQHLIFETKELKKNELMEMHKQAKIIENYFLHK